MTRCFCRSRYVCLGMVTVLLLVSAVAATPPAPTLDLTRYSGVARASRDLIVTAPTDALLGSLPVEEGDAIATGREVAAMDDRVQQAVVEVTRLQSLNEAPLISAKATVAFYELELERAQDMFARNAANEREVRIAEVQLARAKAEVMNAESQLKQAGAALALEQERLDLLHLTAPFDGVVMEVVAEPGAALRVADPILRIAQLDPLEAELPLPAELYGELEIGRRYRLDAAVPVSRQLEARLTRRASEIDPASDTFLAVFEIQNPGQAIPAGVRVSLANLEPIAEATDATTSAR